MMAEEKYNKEVIERYIKDSDQKPLVLIFTAPWISQSIIVDVITEKLITAAPYVNFVTIDTDQDEELAEEYFISKLPSFVVIVKHQIVAKRSGTFSKKNVLDVLNSL